MTTTLEELEKRLTSVEQELALLRAVIDPHLKNTSPARLSREMEPGRNDLAEGWAKFMQKLGITNAPIGAEKLQELMLASGIKPEANALSRAISEMREE